MAKTISNTQELQQALRQLQPNTHITMEDGVYELGNLNIENILSDADHPIHIQARNIGRATLSSPEHRTLHIRNTPHLTLSGFHFDQVSILITNANHVRISQSTFHNTQDSVHWIDFHNASFGRVDHCDFGPRMSKGAYINVRRPSQHVHAFDKAEKDQKYANY